MTTNIVISVAPEKHNPNSFKPISKVSTIENDAHIYRYLGQIVTDTGITSEIPKFCMVVSFTVPLDIKSAFDRWYEEEHIPMLMQANDWLRARRVDVIRHIGAQQLWTSIAFHDLANLEVMDSEERTRARTTPWRAEFAQLPWFAAAGRRILSYSQDK